MNEEDEYYDIDTKQTKKKFNNLRFRYGISSQEWFTMLEEQEGLCKICLGENPTDLDHNHKTLKIRGLLCRNCNTGIGLLGENVNVLERAIKYIEQDGNI